MPATKSKDAIALLKEDHREVKKLFKEFEDAKGEGRKQKLAHQICLELIVHAEIEEKIFYPACEGTVDEDELKEGYVEHDAAKLLIAEIEAARKAPRDEYFDTKVHVLQEEIEHHIEEEEGAGGIFSQARKGKLDMDCDRREARREKGGADGTLQGRRPAASRSSRRWTKSRSEKEAPPRSNGTRGCFTQRIALFRTAFTSAPRRASPGHHVRRYRRRS